MPLYDFHCNKCDFPFDDLCSFEDIKKVKCPKCRSKKITRLFSSEVHAKFTNPQDTSKWDNFGYRAGFNMEKAKGERRAAEAAAKGDDPYAKWDLNKDF